MNIVTGLCLGLLIMVLGSLGMLLFGMYLANREKPRRAKEASIALTREDARRLIELIENLLPISEKLKASSTDNAGANSTRVIQK